MSDFTSEFWSWFIIAIAGGGIIWLFYLLRGTNKADTEEGVPTGHVWDENLEELNNPLPRWWLWMFYITIVFSEMPSSSSFSSSFPTVSSCPIIVSL